MKCANCGSELDPSGVFPGGTVTCACGQQLVVGADSVPQGPYRTAPARDLPAPPQPARAREMQWLCCRCLQPLATHTRDGCVLHACSRGHGVFVQTDDLDRLLSDAASAGAQPSSSQAFRPDAEVRYVRCPVCAELMARKAFAPMSGVIVDVCAHGTWFDAGELEQALAFAASRGAKGVDAAALQRGAPRPDAARALLDVSLATEARRDAENIRNTADVLDSLLNLFSLLTGMPLRPRHF